MEEDPFTVAVALELGVQAVGDGSDWDQIQGSFGWAMSTDIGESCAYGTMDPARSASPHAYRSLQNSRANMIRDSASLPLTVKASLIPS